MGFRGRSALSVSFVALAIALSGGVRAQSASADTPSADTGLQEVVVTAQKRSENLKDIPISISAISGYDLQAKQIANYDDIARAVPGVSFNSIW